MKNKPYRFLALAVACAAAGFCSLIAQPARADGPAKHVVLVVMDGLRPDSVTPELMPALYGLSQRGTFFSHHHPVYFSSTEVNGTAIATGSYPQHDGIMANVEYRPKINPISGVGMEVADVVKRGDETSNGNYVALPTLADILAKQNLQTLIAGTKPVALLLNRKDRPADAKSVTLFEGQSLPAMVAQEATADFGDFPKKAEAKEAANVDQDKWTTRVLTSRMWKDGLPAFSVLWLSEPDYAQHGSGPGTKVAKAALKSSDDNLAYVLKTLDEKKLTESTDVMVVSDHGFSTISQNSDLAATLTKAGLRAFNDFPVLPTTGDVLVISNGGSVCIYVVGHDEGVIKKVVDTLVGNDAVGVIFSRGALPGTFGLEKALIDTPDAPDVVVSMRWDDNAVRPNWPGTIYSDLKKRTPGQGNHTSLSKFDMHNTLVAAGPDFKVGYKDELPTGNPDVAPTILHILGVTDAPKLDGRVLTEALTGGDATGTAKTDRIEATRDLPTGTWTQYLQISTYGGVTYVDEGNGAVTPK